MITLFVIGFIMILIGVMMGWGDPPDKKKGKHKK